MRRRVGAAVVGLGAVLMSVGACRSAAPRDGRATPTAPARDAAAVSEAPPPALEAIRGAELQRDLAELASDAMRGREAGTLDELRASAWLAERAREAGLEPAGEDGTFFQFWPMRRVRLSDASRVTLGGAPLALWRDVVVTAPVDVALDVPVVFVGEGSAAELDGSDLTGKAVAALVTRPPDAPPERVSFAAWRYARLAVARQGRALAERGAAAVLLVADSVTESAFEYYASAAARGSYALDGDGAPHRPPAQPPVLLLRRRELERVRNRVREEGQRLTLALTSESFVYPSVNVVGRVRGREAKLREEYVLFSAHQDHDGVRFPVAGDSIWNGADDNASTSVALLAIARAWVRHPAKRSALFVWHGAEERGLLGSRWHAQHPVVPRSSIVAVLNGDMIGRNAPDSAALLGSQPPHRNSAALVALALRANALTGRFHIDSTWDRPTHPEGWYFRSDHLPYARVGIPALFFSSNLHADYHTPRDEVQRIDVGKLTRMAQWMYATGWLVAEARTRPGVDFGFKLER